MLPLTFKLMTLLVNEAGVIERVLRNAGSGAALVLFIASATGVVQWIAPYNDVFVFGA